MNTNIIIKVSKSYIRYFFTRFIQWIWKQKPYPQADEIRHILIVEPDPIGDMVLATPFLRELRRNFINAKITLVTRPSTYNLMELCPYVDRITVFKKIDGSVGYFLNFFWRANLLISNYRMKYLIWQLLLDGNMIHAVMPAL